MELQLRRSTLESSSASTLHAVCAALIDLTVVAAVCTLTCCAKESAQKVALKRASFTTAFHRVDQVEANRRQVQARALDAAIAVARGCGS